VKGVLGHEVEKDGTEGPPLLIAARGEDLGRVDRRNLEESPRGLAIRPGEWQQGIHDEGVLLLNSASELKRSKLSPEVPSGTCSTLCRVPQN
jgi:hypothetical protein